MYGREIKEIKKEARENRALHVRGTCGLLRLVVREVRFSLRLAYSLHSSMFYFKPASANSQICAYSRYRTTYGGEKNNK